MRQRIHLQSYTTSHGFRNYEAGCDVNIGTNNMAIKKHLEKDLCGKFRITAILAIILAVIMLCSSQLYARMFDITSLKPGMSIKIVQAAIQSQGATVSQFSSTQPQGYADGLIRSKLLVMMNRAKARNQLVIQNDAGRVSFLKAAKGNDQYTMGFLDGKLQALIWIAKRKVDVTVGFKQNAFTKSRLDPLRNHLKYVNLSCKIRPVRKSIDKYGNKFAYIGSCRNNFNVYLEYHPGTDTYRTLYYLR